MILRRLCVEMAKTDFSINFMIALKSILTIESRVPGLIFDPFKDRQLRHKLAQSWNQTIKLFKSHHLHLVKLQRVFIVSWFFFNLRRLRKCHFKLVVWQILSNYTQLQGNFHKCNSTLRLGKEAITWSIMIKWRSERKKSVCVSLCLPERAREKILAEQRQKMEQEWLGKISRDQSCIQWCTCRRPKIRHRTSS